MKLMKRILSCTLSLLLVLVLVAPQQALAAEEIDWIPGMDTYGYSQKKGGLIDPDKVESGTLIIGTHLIHITAMNDKVYRMAEASAAEFNQPNIYYKSDLADGTWFEISSATSVADITTQGAPVVKKDIAKLRCDYWTKPDGLTYRFYGADRYTTDRTWPYWDTVTYIFPEKYDYINPYTYSEVGSPLKAYVEMKSFDIQYEMFRNQESKYNIFERTAIVTWVNAMTNDFNSSLVFGKKLESFENFRVEMLKTGMTSMEKEVMAWVMDNLERQHTVEIMERIISHLENLARNLDTFVFSTDRKASDDFKQSIRESQMNLRSTCAALKSQMIAPGETFLEKKRFSLLYGEIEYAYTSEDMKSALADLVDVVNVINGNIVNPIGEKDVIDAEMDWAFNAYDQMLYIGTSNDYKDAVNNKAPTAMLNSLMSQQNGKLNKVKNEYEDLFLESINRTGQVGAIQKIEESIKFASRKYMYIQNDEFRESAVASLDAHIVFLKNLLKSLTGEESPDEQLQKEKQKLQDSLMEALDENKTDEAEKIRDKIADVDTEITALAEDYAYEAALLEEEIKKTEGELKDAPEEEVEKLADKLAEAKEKLIDIKTDSTDDSLIKVVEELKKDGGDAIDRGDPGAVDVVVDSLISVVEQDPRVVVPAIKDIHDKMVDQGDGSGFKDQIAKAEDAIRDNADAAAEATKPKAEREIELIVGEYDSGEDKRNAAVVAALGQYVYTEAGKGMEDLWKNWLDKLLADNNPYVFVRYNDGGNEYIPYDVLGYFAGMRPVWYQNQQIGTLSKGGDYYSFKVDSTKVGRDKDSTKNDEMTITAKWQTVVHVHESYTKLKFDCEAFYIPNSIYGVLVSPEIKTMLDEILGKIEDAGKTV